MAKSSRENNNFAGSFSKISGKKSVVRRFWNFLWYDDSWLSILAFLVVSSIFIRFIAYPVLGVFLGSSQPIVAVISSSMVHSTNNFDDWWNSSLCKEKFSDKYNFQKDFYSSFNISKEDFENFNLKNGFSKGDVMVLASPKNIKVGDVIVADNGGVTPYPVIHRVIKIGVDSVTTNGDNNHCEIWYFEENISRDKIIGRAWLWIPYIGWVKVGAVWLLSVIGGVF
ncbi:S24/S26 family peptidase [Candidatus Woesearchaeota archaeon]|nr:S24/S26 family peptidase [Candidatus Woesearchaeota archaeon]